MEQKTERKHVWTNTAVVCLVALLCCFLWGSAFPGIKIGYGIFDISGEQTGLQIIFAGTRFFLAGIMAVVIGSFAHKRPLFPKKTSWLPILHLSLLQTTLQYFFFYIGLGKTSGVKASIIEALNVFVALFVACLLFKQEKLKQNKIIGSILGFAGVFLVEIWGSRGTGSSLGGIGIGEICVFISTVAYAFSSVYLRKYSEQEEPFVLSGYQFIVGGITLILLGFLMCIFLPASLGSGYAAMTTGQVLGAVASHMAGGFFSLKGCGIVLYLAMVSAVAYSLWGVLLKYNPVSKVAVFGFTTPIFGVLLSAILLREEDTLRIGVLVISLILVSIGTLMAQKN